MSKRVKNRKGKQGRTIQNAQYCREHGVVIARTMQRRAEALALNPPDPTQGFF